MDDAAIKGAAHHAHLSRGLPGEVPHLVALAALSGEAGNGAGGGVNGIRNAAYRVGGSRAHLLHVAENGGIAVLGHRHQLTHVGLQGSARGLHRLTDGRNGVVAHGAAHSHHLAHQVEVRAGEVHLRIGIAGNNRGNAVAKARSQRVDVAGELDVTGGELVALAQNLAGNRVLKLCGANALRVESLVSKSDHVCSHSF